MSAEADGARRDGADLGRDVREDTRGHLGVDREDGEGLAVLLGAGDLQVVLPPDVGVDLSASVGVGDIAVPEAGIDEGGLGRDVNTTLAAANGVPSSGTFVLDLNVGLGQLEVRRAAS